MRPMVVTIEPGTASLAESPLPMKATASRMSPGTSTKSGQPTPPRSKPRPSRNSSPRTISAIPITCLRPCTTNRLLAFPYGKVYLTGARFVGGRWGRRDIAERHCRPLGRGPGGGAGSGGRQVSFTARKPLDRGLHGRGGMHQAVLDEDVGRTAPAAGRTDDVKAWHVRLPGLGIEFGHAALQVDSYTSGEQQLGRCEVAGKGEDLIGAQPLLAGGRAHHDVILFDRLEAAIEQGRDRALLDAIEEVRPYPVLEAWLEVLAAVHHGHLGAGAVQVKRGVSGAGTAAHERHRPPEERVSLGVVVAD